MFLKHFFDSFGIQKTDHNIFLINYKYLLIPYGDLCKKKMVNHILGSKLIVEDGKQAEFDYVENIMHCGFFHVLLYKIEHHTSC